MEMENKNATNAQKIKKTNSTADNSSIHATRRKNTQLTNDSQPVNLNKNST
jgi:hypothetical protein